MNLDKIKKEFDFYCKETEENDFVDIDLHFSMAMRVGELIREVEHWKKCTESEQNIAGKLQKKVEALSKALVGKAVLSDKVEELTKENAVLKQR